MSDIDTDLRDRVTAHLLAHGATKHGKRLRCNCPFHDDPSASLDWDTDKGVFYCVGCEAQGGISKLAGRLGLTEGGE